MHRPAITVSDDERFVLCGCAELVIGIDNSRPGRPIEHTLGLIDVGAGYRHAQIFQTQAVSCQRCRIGLNANGRPLASADGDQPHS